MTDHADKRRGDAHLTQMSLREAAVTFTLPDTELRLLRSHLLYSDTMQHGPVVSMVDASADTCRLARHRLRTRCSACGPGATTGAAISTLVQIGRKYRTHPDLATAGASPLQQWEEMYRKYVSVTALNRQNPALVGGFRAPLLNATG